MSSVTMKRKIKVMRESEKMTRLRERVEAMRNGLSTFAQDYLAAVGKNFDSEMLQAQVVRELGYAECLEAVRMQRVDHVYETLAEEWLATCNRKLADVAKKMGIVYAGI